MNNAEKNTSKAYSKPHRPIPIALINHLGKLFSHLGIKGASLDSVSLIKAAQKRTGLDDFGEETFLQRLDFLLNAMETEAEYHRFGRIMARQNMIRILVNRLRIEEAFKKHPEITYIEMEDPIFIVGLQRTGTTKLQRLISSDPTLRFLSSWEAMNPAPFTEPFRKKKQDPRIKEAVFAQKAVKYMAPDFFAIHPIDALGPEEDCLLFDFCLYGTVPEATQRVPSFSKWLEKQDHIDSYRYYKKILQYLQWQKPGGRWILKTPQHLEQLDALFTVFPNAKIIQTHRDPVKVISSFCSMISHAWSIFSDNINPHEVGAIWSTKQQRMINRSMDYRKKGKENNFIDISYYDIISDPMNEIEKIYQFLGRSLTDKAVKEMEKWLGSNPQHKHGRHKYSLKDFNLSLKEIESKFGRYRKEYNIRMEETLDN